MSCFLNLFLSFILMVSLLSHFVIGFNITRLLDQHPDFGTFNDYLTQAQLASNINNRKPITVLVVNNSSMGSLFGKSMNMLQKIMSVHVVLDYYDIDKLKKVLPKKKSINVTTLFQTGGVAVNNQGFLNITLSSGEAYVGSAAPGSTLNSQLIGSVAVQPYNISVLQISSLIIPNGIENSNAPFNSPTPPTRKAPSPKSKSSPVSSPAPSPNDLADTPVADTPTSDTSASSSAPSPVAEGPTPVADAPSRDKDVADKEKDEDKNSACGIRQFESWIAILVLVAWAIV